jgi:broad specificity phosphatase PhoE
MPATFYDPTNAEGRAARTMACDAALADLMEYMRQDGVRVAAFDATNSTNERRRHIWRVLKESGLGAKRMFVESICDETELLDENIRKVKLSTPDYRDMDPEQAMADFRRRRELYQTVYEPVDISDGPHIKIVNSRHFIGTCAVRSVVVCLCVCVCSCVVPIPCGARFGTSSLLPGIVFVSRYCSCFSLRSPRLFARTYITNVPIKRFYVTVSNIRGYLPLKVVHFVMNLHTLPRTFYLTRHGQSEYNLLGKIGGDSGLTAAGKEYARRLADFARDHIGHEVVATESGEEQRIPRPARLWTSTLRRTKETAHFIEHTTLNHTWDNGDTGDWVQFRPMARRNLDELYAGVCDGMTYKEIEQVYPEEFARRQDDKLTYRYPRGESYMDVTLRLEPLAQEMERTREPVLIVGHQGILRILYAYFMGLDRNEAPYVNIPLNNVIELTPHAYGCHEKRFCLMRKEEMLNDGQDEPVTSMPVKDGNGSGVANYAPNDPVMNAPSC